MRQDAMFLSEWIELKGVPAVAKLLKVDQNTVRYWRWGKTFPHPEQMRAIKKATKGQVGYDEIIDGPGIPPQKRKKN